MDREPAATAYTLAEEVRILKERTRDPRSFRKLADVRDVGEGIHLAVDQLPTAIQQLSAGLRLLEEENEIRAAEDADASEAVSLALRALLNAEVGLTVARASLRECTGHLSRIDTASVSNTASVSPDRDGVVAP